MLLSNLALASSLQATFQATVGNAEIQNIIQILGLDLGKIWQNLTTRVRHCQRKSLEPIVQSYVCYVYIRLQGARSCANPEHVVPAGSMCL